MPEIFRFLGIIVTMHYKEHAPPHFHASTARIGAHLLLRTWHNGADMAPEFLYEIGVPVEEPAAAA